MKIIIPKIIIFTKNKEDFIKLNKDYNNDKFYIYGGIVTSFNDIKEFLKNKEIKYKERPLEEIEND